MGDAIELRGGFVEFGDCEKVVSMFVMMWDGKEGREKGTNGHSGPTPRGRGTSPAKVEVEV